MAKLNFFGGRVQLLDNNGDPLSGGKVYFYEPGTSTPKDTYTDSALSTTNANPVILDSAGRAQIWLSGDYKVVVTTSADVTLTTDDNINPDPADSGGYSAKNSNVLLKSANYPLTAGDDGKHIEITSGSWTLSTLAAATAGDGFFVTFRNSGSGVITVDPNGSETVNGATSLRIYPGESGRLTTENANWYMYKSLAPAKGHIHGLTLSNGTDADHDIDIAVGEATDSTGVYLMRLLTGLTKQIDATWAAGTDAGGMFTGSVANDTWYHVFLIRKDADETLDAGFDTDVSAANIPTGYTAYRRIGSVLTDGSANILAFKQRGDVFLLSTSKADRNSTSSAALGLLTVSTPLGVRTRPLLSGFVVQAATAGTIGVTVTDGDNVVTGARRWLLRTAFGSDQEYGSCDGGVVTNTSSQIGYECLVTSTTISSHELHTHGWIDDLGRLT